MADEMKYRIDAYIYAQSKYASEHGLPMVRALFCGISARCRDPGWLTMNICLVQTCWWLRCSKPEAPDEMFISPEGKWIDYQTRKVYEGGLHRMRAGKIPVVVLVRDGTVIPHINGRNQPGI
jgi:alpha-D-xyloside xylohydrolase